MDSVHRTSHSSVSAKPRLDRRNALKISEFEPSSPRISASSSSSSSSSGSSSSSSHRRPFFKKEAVSTSLTLTGEDSESQLDRICEELGLSGGIDAFSIPQDVWEAGKSRTHSIDHTTFSNSGSGNSFSSSTTSRSISASSNDSLFSESSIVFTPSGSVEITEGLLPGRNHVVSGGLYLAKDEQKHASERISREVELSMQHETSLPAPPVLTKPLLDATSAEDEVDELRITDLNHQPISSEYSTQQEEASLIPPPNQSKPLHDVPSAQDLEKESRMIDVSEQPTTISEDFENSSVSENNLVRQSEEELVFASQVVQKNVISADSNIPSLVIDPVSQISLPRVNITSWRKLDMLGSGSFGTVYEGLSEDGIYFAVKEVSLSENDSKAQQCVSQLEQEIDVLSRFQHENIVRYFGTQKEPEKLYIFLELVTKGSLASLYQKYPLFDSQIRIYTRQILSGLKYLHDRNIMHRDIKCANILVDTNGRIKVADFGLAKQISKLDELKSCKGSAYWMAPEVIDPRKTYSFPADIWSLGCTVLEMATRGPPFGDLEWHRVLWKVGHGEPPPIPDSLPEDAKNFIRTCLEVDPTKRPSASQLLEHPFVQYTGGSGFTPKNSFCQESLEIRMAIETSASEG